MSATQDEKLVSRFEKMPIGTRKSLIQIGSTVTFEFQRNLKNMFISLGIAVGIYLLSLIINLVQEGRGAESPATAGEYAIGYLNFIGFFILIIAVMFGGSIIALDYDKQTGNLIFPKIAKGRLFIGRLIARYVLSALAVIVYYVLTGVTTVIKYGELPIEIWSSLGWALLYTFLVLSLVVFFSSFMKKTSTTIVVSLVIILMVFNLIDVLLLISGVEIEPLYILTYYERIITAIFNMPTERFVEGTLGGPGPGMEGPSIMQWLTPSMTGAAIGMIVYSAILLTAAYFLFRRRQQK